MTQATNAASRSFFNDGMSVFMTKVIVMALAVLSVSIQARALGPAERGVLAMLLIYPQVLTSIAEGGMRQATVYYVGQGSISDARIFGTSVIYTIMSGLIFSTLIFFILGNAKEHDYTFLMMLTAALMLPVNLMMNAIRGMFLGKQHISQFNTSQWLQKLLMVFAFAVMFFLDKLTAETAIVCMLLSSMIGFLPAVYFFFREIYTHIEFDTETLWRMAKKGAVYAIAMFLMEANYKFDILLMGWLSNKEEVGLYSIAVSVGELLWQLPAAIGVVVFSRSANDRNSSLWQAELARSIRISLWVTLAGCAVLAVISPLLFDVLFGDDFDRSVNMLLCLMPGLILMVIFKLLIMDLAGKGRPVVSLVIMLPVLALSVAMDYVLIPKLGGIGAAITSTVCYSLASLVLLAVYARMYKMNPLDFVLIKADDVKLMTSKVMSKIPVRREA